MSTGADEVLPIPETPEAREPEPDRGTLERRRPRGRLSKLAFLLFGGLVATYLWSHGAHEQHLRVMLGSAAQQVTGVDIAYYGSDGELVRDAHFTYAPGSAPRVVPHEAKLPNGDYRLQIDVDARDGRRSVQRRVTLGGGSTQVDVSNAIERDDRDDKTREKAR